MDSLKQEPEQRERPELDGAAAEEDDEEDEEELPKNVIVIGATNRPDSIDPALRRAGRFDREISLGIPDEAARARILATLARGLRVGGGVNWATLARGTPGFVGADLAALTREAATVAIKRIFGDLGKQRGGVPVSALVGAASADDGGGEAGQAEPAANGAVADESEAAEAPAAAVIPATGAAPSPAAAPGGVGPAPLSRSELAPLCIGAEDFTAALSVVQPSSQREGFATIPDVSFDDVGGLTEVRTPSSPRSLTAVYVLTSQMSRDL